MLDRQTAPAGRARSAASRSSAPLRRLEAVGPAGPSRGTPTAIEDVAVRTVFDEPHHQSLEILAAVALRDGDAVAAFRLADRRCRIRPAPEPHGYVLRAEACFRLGRQAAAVADLRRALDIAPDDLLANRRMLAWAEGGEQSRAAAALVAHEHDSDVLRRALDLLRVEGHADFASLTVLDRAIEGWAIWTLPALLAITVCGGDDSATRLVAPDPSHPLRGPGHAASFHLPRPRSSGPQTIEVTVADRVLACVRTAGNDAAPAVRPVRSRRFLRRERSVSVVVPVYGDYAATRACLECLLGELGGSPQHRAIVVDDATPDPDIAAYLCDLAAEPRVELLSNARNLGFVGAVNRALAVAEGDVLLLNADTLVPTGFIDRLAVAARSSADIGTVTPLSNNGEFTSFPLPYVANPLPSLAEIREIDRIAARVNRSTIVDIPAGIGFCLYITRACLDAVGPLSEDYHRGYLEDADFCLRARERGFRSVCATSVYVGHAGTRSFGLQKRSLVVRNLGRLERRFPQHRAECVAFMAADPLRPPREAVERLYPPAARRRLLVSGTGVVAEIARERARQLAAAGQPTILVEATAGPSPAAVRFRDPDGGLPQSLAFDLSLAGERTAMIDYVRGLGPAAVEFLDPFHTPVALVELLLELGAPYDVFIADAGLLGRAVEIRVMPPGAAATSARAAAARRTACEAERDFEDQVRLRFWRAVAEGADRILAPCREAQAFAASFLARRAIVLLDAGATRPRSRKRTEAGTGLGLVPARMSVGEHRLMAEIVRRLRILRPDVAMTILGTTRDDVALMRLGNVFVTGEVDAAEFDAVVDAYGLGRLLVVTDRPLFGHRLANGARQSGLPTAYIDWSMGGVKPLKRNLSIDPRAPLEAMIDRLVRWLADP